MSQLARALIAELDETMLDQLADALVPHLADRIHGPAPSPWMNVQETAEYLRAKPQRVYDLRSQGRITPSRTGDGGRPLYHRDDIDAYLRGATNEDGAPAGTDAPLKRDKPALDAG